MSIQRKLIEEEHGVGEPVKSSKFDKIKDIVYRTLKRSEESRNDDKRLIYEILVKEYGLVMSFDQFSKFPSFESITRCRRHIQNDEVHPKFKPTDPKVAWHRGIISEIAYREYFKVKGKV